MNVNIKYKSIAIALLVLGGAILLISCSDKKPNADKNNNEALITEQSDSLVVIQSKSGDVEYRFETPLLERYSQAREPYMEFRKGIRIDKLDSLGNTESTLISDYAIYFEQQDLWEAKGNVVATNAQGHILETQQLFWNRRTKKIYSNIDSKMTQGTDVLYGIGFESDEDFKVWEVRKPRGKAAVDIEPNRDTASVSSTDPDKVVNNSPEKPEARREQARPANAASRNANNKRELQFTREATPAGEDNMIRPSDRKIEKEMPLKPGEVIEEAKPAQQEESSRKE